VSRDQIDRAGALEVFLEVACLVVNLVRQHMIDCDALLAAVADSEADAAKQKERTENKSKEGRRTHDPCIDTRGCPTSHPEGAEKAVTCDGP
jgi:hypothetical protein